MRGGFRGRGRGRGGGPGDMRAMQALREPPKAPGVLYPPFAEPSFIAPPTEFEDLILQYSMELEDTMRDGIGLPYRPPPPVRSAADRAAEAASSSSSSSRSKSKSKSKSKSRDKEVDMEDMDGVLPNGGGNGNGLGQGQGLGPELSMYAQGGLAEDQVAFCGWRIPDARRVVGIEIDDLSDRPSKWGQSTSLRQAAASDKLDKDLMFLDPAFFPPGLWEAHFEDDEKTKSRLMKRKRDEVRDENDLDLPDLDEEDRDSNASSREDPDQFADEEEMDHEDYDANYFDNGEGDDDEGGDEGGGGGDNDF